MMPQKVIATWDDVDKSLKEISEITNEIKAIESDLSAKLAEAQEMAVKLTTPLKAKIKLLEERIKSFTETNMHELNGKSKKLNFGQVGFRKSVKTEFLVKVDELIVLLKKHKMLDCIEIKESVSKNSMKRYTDQELERVNVRRVAQENFFIKLTKGKTE